MKITAASLENGKLILTLDGMRDAFKFAKTFIAGEYEIKKVRKRSLDANAYAWVLIDKLAIALSMGKSEIYRNAICEIGGVSKVLCVQASEVDSFCADWQSNGLGWQTERFESKIDGCVNVIIYSGSSRYDTKQMSLLIDSLIEDCRALEIETLPPYKLQGLLESWNDKKNKSPSNTTEG